MKINVASFIQMTLTSAVDLNFKTSDSKVVIVRYDLSLQRITVKTT